MSDTQEERFAEMLAKARAEHAEMLSKAKEAYILEGQKSYIAINGGGAVALLAFIQAIWDKDYTGPLKWAALVAVLIFALGAAIGAASYEARHWAFREGHVRIEDSGYKWAYIYIPRAAVGAFVLASLITVVGGVWALVRP